MKISTIRKALVLLALMIAVAVPAFAFAGGSGTSSDPYLVATLDDLKAVASNPTAHYKQTANICINDATLVDMKKAECTGTAWNPIDFSGSYNGGGYYITGLYVTDENAVGGLFGTLTNASVTNLKLDFALVEADEYAGIIAGKAENSTINNVFASGVVVGKTTKAQNTIGGIVGVLSGENASIVNCASYATVAGAISYSANIGGVAGINAGLIQTTGFGGSVAGSATYYDASIGGIAGYNVGGIENSRTASFATVAGESTAKVNDCNVGGIAGLNKGTITWCQNDAAVSNNNYSSGDSICSAGGIVGASIDADLSENTNNGTVNGQYVYAGGIAGVAVSDSGSYLIDYCDNTGAITSLYGVAGGIVGRAVAAGEGYVSIKLTINECYNAGSLSGNATSEMAGETATVDSASVNVAEEGAQNYNSCSAKAPSTITAEEYQYGQNVESTGVGSQSRIETAVSGKFIIRHGGDRNTFAPAPVLVTLTKVSDASKVEILSVDASGLTLSGTTLSGTITVRVYKPDTNTVATAVTGVSVGNKYAATSFDAVDSTKRVDEVEVQIRADVDTFGTLTVNALVVSDTDSMAPLCENKEVTK